MPRIAILVAFALTACAPRPPATLHEAAEDYVRLTLQFAQHQPSLVDAWVGPESWRPGPRVPVAELNVALDALIARTARLRNIDRTERPRVDYLRRQLGALKLVARRLLGEPTRFADELEVLYAGRVPSPQPVARSAQRAALEHELPGEGELIERIAAFRSRFLVPADRVGAVFNAAVEACRRATAAHIQLPSDERVELRVEAGGDFAATAAYAGRHQTRIRLSSGSRHDVAELLHIACHETYPGHHLQHVLIDDALVRGRGWAEFQLTPAFGSHLMVSESWAETGAELAMPETESARVYRDTLMPLAGLPTTEADRLARVNALTAPFAAEAVEWIGRYLDNERSAEETRDALRARALILAPDQLIALVERRRAAAVVYAASKLGSDNTAGDAPTKWRKLHDVFTVTPFVLE